MTVKRNQRRFVKTRTPNLVRYLNTGEYYLLYKLSGKQVHTPLKTTDYKVARNRRNEQMSLIEKQRQVVKPKKIANTTIGDLCDKYVDETENDLSLTHGAKHVRLAALKRLVKTYPGLLKKKPNQLELKNLLKWYQDFNLNGTSYVPKGA
ncbi:MAG: hypothetical protein CMI15_07280, partial [Opitutaceae bacterium]|nr:hypothetical protein [Opitutaceae bacterium]